MRLPYNEGIPLPKQRDFRNIIGRGQNDDGSRWYVVSSRDPKTGRMLVPADEKVVVCSNTYCHRCEESDCGHFDTIRELENILEPELVEDIREELPWLEFDARSYSCSCGGSDDNHEGCIDIMSLKYFEEELSAKKSGFAVQRTDEIKILQEKIGNLASEEDLYEEIKVLRLMIEDKEKESQQIIEILQENERLEQEKLRAEQEKQEAIRRAESLGAKRFASLYSLPREVQSYILTLAKLEPVQIEEILGGPIYQRIPHSAKTRKAKIILGKSDTTGRDISRNSLRKSQALRLLTQSRIRGMSPPKIPA